MITASLQPLLQKTRSSFSCRSELVVVLLGPGTAERLQYMVDHLNSRKIVWNKTELDIEFGASRAKCRMGKACTTRWVS